MWGLWVDGVDFSGDGFSSSSILTVKMKKNNFVGLSERNGRNS